KLARLDLCWSPRRFLIRARHKTATRTSVFTGQELGRGFGVTGVHGKKGCDDRRRPSLPDGGKLRNSGHRFSHFGGSQTVVRFFLPRLTGAKGQKAALPRSGREILASGTSGCHGIHGSGGPRQAG